jgi:NADPH-dependent glutamate synthase beta subunit-like oxidoreductase
LTPKQHFLTSKDFLPESCVISKGIEPARPLPKLHGRVIVMGGGDVAADCAQTALRCGAEHVSLVFRKNTADMRAMPEEIEHMMSEQIDFIPYMQPTRVITDDKGVLVAIEFCKQEKRLDGTCAFCLFVGGADDVSALICSPPSLLLLVQMWMTASRRCASSATSPSLPWARRLTATLSSRRSRPSRCAATRARFACAAVVWCAAWA